MTVVKQIPDILIYEMDNGKPIYYSGYGDVINGTLPPEAIMGSSILRSLLITELVKYLIDVVPKNYFVLCSKVGVLFSEGNWRSADIAIIEKSRIQKIEDKYISAPPNTIIEVDSKAALEDYENPQDYYTLKTQRYLDFGVDKVVWIYTKSRNIQVSTKIGKTIYSWANDIAFLDELGFNLEDLMREFLG